MGCEGAGLLGWPTLQPPPHSGWMHESHSGWMHESHSGWMHESHLIAREQVRRAEDVEVFGHEPIEEVPVQTDPEHKEGEGERHVETVDDRRHGFRRDGKPADEKGDS